MSGHDEEQLSALHDGELQGDELAAAERLLAASAAARETMDEFAELRGMLNALPRPSAPPELRSAVLNRIRAEQPVVAAPPTRRRIHPAVPWAALAACLFIAVGLYSFRPMGNEGAEMLVADAPAPAATSTFDGARRTAAIALDESGTRDTALPMAASAPADEAASDEAHLEAVDLDRLRTLVANGELPVPGELIPDFREVDGRLLLVEYSVVDVHNMFGEMQVILARNGITAVTPEGHVLASSDDASGELYGIYVDAPSSQFVAALGELNALDGVVAVSTAATEEGAPITDDIQSQPVAAAQQQQQFEPAAPPSATRTRQAESADAEPADEPTADAPRATPAVADIAEDDTARQAYQLPVPLRRDRVAELQTDESLQADRQRRQQQADAELPAEPQVALHSDAAAEGNAPGERVRVVIVFLPQADH